MINELYVYSNPKLSGYHKEPFRIFCLIFGSLLFSSFVVLVGKIIFGFVLMASYLLLSLLSLAGKDFKSKYLRLTSLCLLDISLASLGLFATIWPNHQIPLWSVIFCFFFWVIYEIIWFVKIKKRLYSCPSKSKKSTYIVSTSSVLLCTLILRIIRKISQTLAVTITIFLCSATVLISIISLQKLIIYLLTRNKIQESCDDESQK